MTNVNQFNITDEELREIEQIKELAQDCTTHLLECLVDPDTEEKVELNEEDKKDMYKFILIKLWNMQKKTNFQMMEMILTSISNL